MSHVGHTSIGAGRSLRKLLGLLSLRPMLAKPVHALLTVACVALGVALFTAVQVLHHVGLMSVERSTDVLAGKAAMVVSSRSGSLSASTISSIREVDGVLAGIPRLVRQIEYRDSDGIEAVTLIGLDFSMEGISRNIRALEFEVLGNDREAALAWGSVFLTKSFARARGRTLGDSIELRVGQTWESFQLRGWLEPVGFAKVFGGAAAIMQIAHGQRLIGADPGTLQGVDRIDVLVGKDVDPERVAEELRARLGPGVSVSLTARHADSLARGLASYRTTLSLFAFLTLVGACFLLATSINFHVQERRSELALLRLLGAPRPLLFKIVACESLLIGAVASLLGAGGGLALASHWSKTVEQSLLAQFEETVLVRDVVDPTALLLWTLLVGCVLALVAALPAARRAALLPAMALLRAPAQSGRAAIRPGLQILFGLLGLGFVIVSAASHLSLDRPVMRFVNALAAIAGIALLAPPVVTWLGARCLGQGRVTRPLAWLCSRRITRLPAGTRALARMLTIALATLVVLGSVRTSMERTVDRHIVQTLQADIVLGSSHAFGIGSDGPYPESVLRAIEDCEGVRPGVLGERVIRTMIAGTQVLLVASDGFADSEGEQPTVVLSQRFVREFAREPGETLVLQTPTGPLSCTVSGSWELPTSRLPAIGISRAVYARSWLDRTVDRVRVRVEAGRSSEDVAADLRRRVSVTHSMPVLLESEYRAMAAGFIARGFGFARAIESIVLLLACLGAATTSWLAMRGRSHELAILRAIGVSRRRLGWMIIEEHGWLGGACGLVAIACGTVVAWAWTRWALPDALGWSVDVHFPIQQVLLVLLLGTGVSCIAGAAAALRLPARSVRP